jgi:hypothetical protein
LLKSDLARHTKLHFGSERDPAPKPKLGANPLGAFAHSLKTPVTIPPPLKFLGINTAPVVTDGDAKLAGPKLNFCLNILCTRVAVSIYYGFAANAINFVAQPSPQSPLLAMNNDSKANRGREPKIGANTGKGVAERCNVLSRGS